MVSQREGRVRTTTTSIDTREQAELELGTRGRNRKLSRVHHSLHMNQKKILVASSRRYTKIVREA
jgi:hypothetical protein